MPATLNRFVKRIAFKSQEPTPFLISRRLSYFDESFNGGRGSRDEERTQRRGSEPRRDSTPNPNPSRQMRSERRGELAGDRLPSSSLEFLKKPSVRNDDEKLGNDRFLDKMTIGGGGKKEKNSRGLTETKMADVDEIFKKMKENGLIPNAVAMLDGLCKDGLVYEAMKLFRLMREKGQIPQVVVYTAVVEGFCKASKCEDARRIFRKMQANGVVPNAFSYTVLIQGILRCGEVDAAVEYGLEMLGAGHSPNVVTLVGLVDGVAREKGVEVAQMFIHSLREKGYFVDEKAVRIYLDKNAPNMHLVAEAIFGTKNIHKVF